jgi:hypothetical protein
MARGFVWAVYYTDGGAGAYARQVDADHVQDPIRGWSTDGVAGAQLFPQRAKPRMVYGVSPTTGRRGHTIVGNAAADLWTGAATSFSVETNDPAEPTDTLVVTRRRGESFAVPR